MAHCAEPHRSREHLDESLLGAMRRGSSKKNRLGAAVATIDDDAVRAVDEEDVSLQEGGAQGGQEGFTVLSQGTVLRAPWKFFGTLLQ